MYIGKKFKLLFAGLLFAAFINQPGSFAASLDAGAPQEAAGNVQPVAPLQTVLDQTLLFQRLMQWPQMTPENIHSLQNLGPQGLYLARHIVAGKFIKSLGTSTTPSEYAKNLMTTLGDKNLQGLQNLAEQIAKESSPAHGSGSQLLLAGLSVFDGKAKKFNPEAVDLAYIERSANQSTPSENQSKTEFLSRTVRSIAHDMNNQLSVTRGGLELARDFTSGGEAAKAEKHLNNSLATTYLLEDLIHQLLDLPQSDPDTPLTLTPLDLSAVLAEELAKYWPGLKENHLHIHSHLISEAKIRGNEFSLQRVIGNLITNAIKYNHAGGKISISLDKVRNGYALTFGDTGIGISEKDLQGLFQPLFRTRSALDSKVRGTGMGLSIVKSLVEQHGGYVHVHSELGKGTTFTLFFPAISENQNN